MSWCVRADKREDACLAASGKTGKMVSESVRSCFCGATMALHQMNMYYLCALEPALFLVCAIFPTPFVFTVDGQAEVDLPWTRDRSFHFGTQEYKIIGMISHLGPQCGIADGIAFGNISNKIIKQTIVFQVMAVQKAIFTRQ